MIKKLIIFGNGEFASMAKYYFNKKVSYFCVDDNFSKENNFVGVPIISYTDLINLKLKDDFQIFVAPSTRWSKRSLKTRFRIGKTCRRESSNGDTWTW